jgi:HK97 family phage major capsid protein
MPTKEELHKNGIALIEEARKIQEAAQKRGGTLDAAERVRVDAIFAERAKILDATKQIDDDAKRMAELDGLIADDEAEVEHRPAAPATRGNDGSTIKYRNAAGVQRCFELPEGYPAFGPEYRDALGKHLRGKIGSNARDLQVGIGSAGGFLLPQAVLATVWKDLDDNNYVRANATVYPVGNAESLGVPTLEADPSDAEWTAEIDQTPTSDTTMAFGRRELKPSMVVKRLDVSRRLLQRMPGVESFVLSRLAYKHAVMEEKAFLSGDGLGKPLGLFTASANGISTSRDVNSGANTAFTSDALKAGILTLKAQYRSRAIAICHRDTFTKLAQLKDGENRYYMQYNLAEPDVPRIMGIPVYESEFAPSGSTQNTYGMVVGDMSYYAIADALTTTVERVGNDTTSNNANKTYFYLRKETDAMPIMQVAFVRFKYSA